MNDDINEIRVRNLMVLATKFDSDRQFCAAAGLNHSYYPQLKSGMKRIAGPRARRIERQLGLDPLYLDTEHPSSAPPVVEAPPPDPRSDQQVAAALGSLPRDVRDQIKRLVFELTLALPKSGETRDVDPLRFKEQLADQETRQAKAE